MIVGHEIIQRNHREFLILYFDFSNEFGKFGSGKRIGEEITSYIKNHHLEWVNKVILLAIGGMPVASFLLSPVSKQEFFDVSHTFVSDELVLVLKEIPKADVSIDEMIDSSEEQENTVSIEREEGKTDVSSPKKENVKRPNNSSDDISNQSSTEQSNQNASSSTGNTNTTPETTEEAESKTMVTVYRQSGAVLKIELEKYLIGVVAGEMPASFPSEALKAQAIVARTYTLKSMQEGERLTDTTATQVYLDEQQLRNNWGSSYDTYYNKVKQAVESTKGMVVVYQGQYIDAVYHSTNNGKTEKAKNVWGYDIPYLQPVESPWDLLSTFYHKTVEVDFVTILNTFQIGSPDFGILEIMDRNESGYVTSVNVFGKIVSGKDFRKQLSLASSDFDLSFQDGMVSISTRGWGHGVGLSQYGAAGMAREGYSAEHILKHYYRNVSIVSQ